MVIKLDFVGVPSQDAERSRRFYVETLGLRPDDQARFEAWAADTCLGIWEPERFGMEFAPQKNGHLALHVDDVAEARSRLEGSGVEFFGETMDTGVCQWPSSRTLTATTLCCITVTCPTTDAASRPSPPGSGETGATDDDRDDVHH